MQIMRRFLTLLRPYYPQGATLGLALLFSTVLTVSNPFLYKVLVDQGITRGNTRILVQMLVIILIIMALQEGLYLWRTAIIAAIRKGVFVQIRFDLYRHLLQLPQSFYADTPRGRLLSRLTADVEAVSNLLLDRYIYLAYNLLVGLAILGVIAVIQWQMVLVAALFLPLLYLFYRFHRRRLYLLNQVAQERSERLLEGLQEDLAMVKAIQSFSVLDDRMARTHRRLEESIEAQRQVTMAYSAANASTTSINMIGLVVIWGMGGLAVTQGRITIGTLIAISFYLTYVINLFYSAYNAMIGFQTSLPAAHRIFAVLDLPAVIADSPEAVDVGRLHGSVALCDVSYAYPNCPPVFTGVNLTLHKGEIVGIVGASGQGKTTLANLLMRFMDPTAGSIQLDGVDLRNLKLACVRRNVALVPQEDSLFDLSIRENIVLGRREITEAQFLQACRLARVDGFADALPQGYDTPVGENGARLSTGQRKRVSIARALLEDPYILIFDEATSVLDEQTEQEILDSVRLLARERIVLLITHKTANLHLATKVVRIAGGAVSVEMAESF